MKHTLLDYVAACRELLASNGAKFNEKGEVLGIKKNPSCPKRFRNGSSLSGI